MVALVAVVDRRLPCPSTRRRRLLAAVVFHLDAPPQVPSLAGRGCHLATGALGSLGSRLDLFSGPPSLHHHLESPQARVDEPGRPGDRGRHLLVNLVEGARPGHREPERLELDPPEAEHGSGSDLRLGVVGAHAGAVRHRLGGHLDKPVHHVALSCAQ